MATTSSNHKYNQLKWMYSALSGLCVAYFLALFSSSSSLADSVLLQPSTLLYACRLLQLLRSHTFFMAKLDAKVEACDEILKESWVERLTSGSFSCLTLAFTCLIGHFSINAMLGFIFVSMLCFYCFAQFAKKLLLRINRTH